MISDGLPRPLALLIGKGPGFPKPGSNFRWKWMISLEIGLAYQFLFCITLGKALIPGSSAVEQATVNRLAGGSNPSRGAKFVIIKSIF